MQASNSQNARCLVRTNEVAPIIIRDCREEFQHVSDFKEPIIYGHIADNMPEHPLIKGKYFLVRDVTEKIDKNKSYDLYRAPNVHKAKGGFPVYSSGQPTERGLVTLLDKLVQDSFTEIILFNLREEPVLFVSNGSDMIPYSIRDQDDLHNCVIVGRTPTEADEAEARVRKEVIDLATIQEENKFYFYKDIDHLHREPHELHVQYEDNLLVSEEVYARHVLCTHGVKYQRLCFPLQSAPSDQDVDLFLDMFKVCPKFFEPGQPSKTAILFTCQTGIGRSTVGTVMGCLILAHRRGLELSKNSKMDKMSSLEKGEYMAVRELVSLLPNGEVLKNQVDSIIDQCAHFCNLRADIWESKHYLEGIKKDYILDGKKAKETIYRRCCDYLERYIFLICFNAYLTEQYPLWFTTSFSKWMQRHPEINRLRGTVCHPCRSAPLDIFTNEQCLVADDYIGLDVLSTQIDVRVSNFRRINIKGFSIYGMAQPARDGATKVSNHLLSKKQGHTFLVLVNLRNDCVIECDGATYSVRDSTYLEEPIIHPGIKRPEIEEKEEILKREIKTKKSIRVYGELSEPPVQRDVSSILTTYEIADQQKLQTLDMQYYRIPLRYDNRPQEQDFDDIMELIYDHYINESPKSNTACVFYCRTGKSRTTFALAVSGLVLCHAKGFPKGSNVGEEERVSCPNAQYTKGDFMIVQKLVRLLPNGHQIKREVDFVLDECFETMSPMHFHIREVIFVKYNKIKHAKTESERQLLKRQSLDFLERYLYLILFNCYLHHDRKIKWQRKFSDWMKEVAVHVGVYELLDNLGFYDFEKVPTSFKTMQERWKNRAQPIPFHGAFT